MARRASSGGALRGGGGPGRWSVMARCGAEPGGGGPRRSGSTLRRSGDRRTGRCRAEMVEPGGPSRRPGNEKVEAAIRKGSV
jgi:hypothetical protein